MNWITQIEKRKILIVGGILLIAFVSLVVTSLRSPIAADPFWHLQMGKDWLENGLSPWVDHYSFTYNGKAITNPPVVFQGLLHLAVSQFGTRTGFLVLRFGLFILSLGAALLLLRQMKAPVIIYAILIPMIVFLLQMRAIVRPELFSYTLSIVALMLYFRADSKLSKRNLIPMVVLMWFWSNYHSAVFGYVIFFGFFLDCAIAQIASRAPAVVWTRWLAWGLLLLAVGFVNPSFSHPLIEAITFPSEWKVLIDEYLPPAPFFKSIAGFYVLTISAVLTPVLALRQRQFGLLVIWAVFTFSAVNMQRMVVPAGIVVVLITAYLLTISNIFHRSMSAGSKFWSGLIGLVTLGSISVTLYSNVERARFDMELNRGLVGRYPVAMADYMLERGMSGRILNDYGMGGYLIHRLTPQNQFYIDGRTQILYPLEHMKRYGEVFGAKHPEVLRTELDKYSINLIIRKHSQLSHDLIQEMGGFGMDFLDARYVLYTRGASNFPLLGKLMSYPECWKPDMRDELNAERRKMDEILPRYSGLFKVADLIVGYTNADDGKAFFDASIDGEEWLDEMRRFAGFRFLETGQYVLVANLLGGLEIKKPKDYLASALAMMMNNDYDLASQIIEEYSNIQWSRIQSESLYIHYKLYQILERQRKLTLIEQKRAEKLRSHLKNSGYPELDSDQVPAVESFCTNF